MAANIIWAPSASTAGRGSCAEVLCVVLCSIMLDSATWCRELQHKAVCFKIVQCVMLCMVFQHLVGLLVCGYFHAIGIVFQLYIGGDMMYDMRRNIQAIYTFTDSRDL